MTDSRSLGMANERIAELEDVLRRINGHLASCVDTVTTADVHLVKGIIRTALGLSQ